jgi:hypothetical protein
LEPAAERVADDFAVFAPFLAPVDAAFVARLAPEAPRFAVFFADEPLFLVAEPALRAVFFAPPDFFAAADFFAPPDFLAELFVAELFLAVDFFAEPVLAVDFFVDFFAELFVAELPEDLRPALFLAELLRPDDLRPDEPPPVTRPLASSTAETPAPAAVSAAWAARVAALAAVDAARDAVDWLREAI